METFGELVPTLVAFIGAVISLFIVSVKTRTASLQNVLKKVADTTASNLNVSPDDAVIIYQDEIIPFSDVKIVKKSELTYEFFMKNFETLRKGGLIQNEKTDEK